MKIIVIDALVLSSVLIVLTCIAGMVRMRDSYQRLHYIAPPAFLSAILITIAIFLQRGLKPESFKALFTTLILIAMNSLVTHAAARAYRIAEETDWKPKEGDEVPIRSTDEPAGGEKAA